MWGSECVISTAMYPCINTAVPGSTEMGDGQFHSPSSIAIDDNLNSNIRGIYVAD